MVVDPTIEFEKSLWKQGFQLVAGIDEAGRGAWAGPVMAGAAILPVDYLIGIALHGVRDSKMLSPAQREKMAEIIKAHALSWAVGSADNLEIDQIGILPATKLAMRRALEALSVIPDYLLIDFVHLPEIAIPQLSIVKGDAKSLSIASASILAKTTRDKWMTENAAVSYPHYGFEKHKGYGTKLHRDRIAEWGPCEIHRLTFKPFNHENSAI